MVLGTLALLALGTGAAISAPVVAREATKAFQVISATPGVREMPGFRAVSRTGLFTPTVPQEQKELSKPKVVEADIEARDIVRRQVEAEGGLSPLLVQIPGVRAGTAPAYQSAIIGTLRQKGYTQKQAEKLGRALTEQYRAESAGEAAGAITASALAEGVGASVAQKAAGTTVAKQALAQSGKAATLKTLAIFGGATGIGGVYEGATTAAIRQAPGLFYRGKPFDIKAFGYETAIGGASAGILGGGIATLAVKGKGFLSKGLLWGGAYTLDPYELPGDILGGRLAATTGYRGVTVPTLTITPTPTAAPTPTMAAVPVTIPTPSETPVAAPTATPTPTPTPTPTVVPTITPTPTPTTTPTPVPTPTETPTETTTEITIVTPTPTPTPTTTPTPTPIYRYEEPPYIPVLPPIPSLHGERGIVRGKKVAYFDEWAAASRTYRQLMR